MELKWKKDLADDSLELLAKEALSQIDKNRYDLEIKEDGITDILKFGIAFSGKKIQIQTVDHVFMCVTLRLVIRITEVESFFTLQAMENVIY